MTRDYDRYYWCHARHQWVDTPRGRNYMPQRTRLQTLLDILRALADAVEQQYGTEGAQQRTPDDAELDQALAHAGDVARRMKLDPVALLQQPSERYPDSERNDPA